VGVAGSSRCARQGEKYLVESGPPQGDVVDLDVQPADGVNGGGDRSLPVGDGYGHPAGTAVYAGLFGADWRQHAGEIRQVSGAVRPDLDHVAPGESLEFGCGAVGDDLPMVDDCYLVGELVCLVEILRCEEDISPLRYQAADRLPELVAAAGVE